MSTEIASIIHGRRVHPYDLLHQVEELGLSTAAAHEAIHALLDQIIDLDGEDAVILDRRPIYPQLEIHNERDLDRYYWLTISDETAEAILDAVTVDPSEDSAE